MEEWRFWTTEQAIPRTGDMGILALEEGGEGSIRCCHANS